MLMKYRAHKNASANRIVDKLLEPAITARDQSLISTFLCTVLLLSNIFCCITRLQSHFLGLCNSDPRFLEEISGEKSLENRD